VWAPNYFDFGDHLFITPDTSYQVEIPWPTPLDDFFDFYWTVAATDGQDTVMAANGQGHIVLPIDDPWGGSPPGPFSRIFPQDSVASDSGGRLRWTRSIDPDGEAVTYLLHVWTDYSYWLPPDSVLVLGTMDTTLDLGIPIPLYPLDEIFHFWWRIWARDNQFHLTEASNGEGMFMLDIVMSAGDDFILPPSSFILSAYPNPFNPTTTLSLSLPIESDVVLKVFDITGRLATERRFGYLAAGIHAIPFDGASLPSGIYLAAMEAANTRLIQKLVLMK
jgi:hypothetical protein